MSDFLFVPVRREGSNCYLVACTVSSECMVVDPVSAERVAKETRERGLNLRYIVLTHGHEQHRAGAEALRSAGTDVRIAAHPAGGFLQHGDRELQDGDSLVLGRLRVNVVATPGACKSGISLFLPFGPGRLGSLLTGSALLAGRIGKTPDPEGADLLRRSIRERVLPLGDAVRIYPARGPASTIGVERHHNPFLE